MGGDEEGDPLSDEDRLLWNRIAQTVKPLESRDRIYRSDYRVRLPGSKASPAGHSATGGSPGKTQTGARPARNSQPTGLPAKARLLDDKSARKLNRGKIAIDSRIDLHGMTQTRAHTALFSFLSSARNRGHRVVLVITGKGRGGEGVLRRAVPTWLEEGSFRELASAWREAGPAHGGEGALYIRLRRFQDRAPSRR